MSVLREILLQKKQVILKRWFDLVLDSYPPDTRDFLRSKKDRFENPVGHTVYDGIRSLYDGLLGEAAPEDVSRFMDNVIRVRAVQQFSPSEALSFIFLLKEVIRDEIQREGPEARPSLDEIMEFESRVDALALRAFDMFMRCRERIYEIRNMEIQNRTINLLKMAGLVSEIQEEAEMLKDGATMA